MENRNSVCRITLEKIYTTMRLSLGKMQVSHAEAHLV